MTTGRGFSALMGVALIGALLLVFFGEVLLQGQVLSGGDIARLYLPLRVALREALKQGRLPWWSPEMGIGYPLLAEGEAAALYPPHWPLTLFFAPEVGLTLSVLLHVVWMALGFYMWGRALGLSRAAATLMAMIPTLGGFGAAHQGHPSILAVISWHPWMLLATQRLFASHTSRRRLGAALGLAMAAAIQFLAGHPQMALLGCALVVAWAAKLWWEERRARCWRKAMAWGGAMALGALLALPQLWPSVELALHSQRAGGLEATFFTSYSMHPLLFATYVSPFLLGNPYPSGSVELMGYVGMAPLALASVALWRRPRRDVWFYAALGVVGAVLALGRWNPLYHYLERAPLLNLFRVPARYLYWSGTALAALAGYGLDALRNEADTSSRRATVWCVVVAALAGASGAASVWATSDADALVALWRWLPLLWALATAILLAWAHRARPGVWTLAMGLLLVADLYSYNGVLGRTYNTTAPRQQMTAPPAVLNVLAQEEAPYRLYVKEEILPAMSVMRASLYPNMALTHGISSANLYTPLMPQTYGAVLDELSPRWLNLLNARYYLIPQLLPVDEGSELYDVQNPFSAPPLDEWLPLGELDVVAIEVESYLSHATDLPDGALAATFRLRTSAGEELAFPLRAGIETAEWAYQRSDVMAKVAHSLPTLATCWPASSGFPPEEHEGCSYLARWQLPSETRLNAMRIEPAMPAAFVRVERVRLLDGAGGSRLLAHLIGLADHQIVYRSEDVLVYRNQDALPRVFALPQDQALRRGEEITLPEELPHDGGAIEGLEYGAQQVRITVAAREPSYLVLADLHYPGWQAVVDGAPAPLLRVEGMLRAVALESGRHEVIFRYRPLSLTARWHRR